MTIPEVLKEEYLRGYAVIRTDASSGKTVKYSRTILKGTLNWSDISEHLHWVSFTIIIRLNHPLTYRSQILIQQF